MTGASSAFAPDVPSTQGGGFWESRLPSFTPVAPTQRSASGLLAGVQQLVERMLHKRVPRLEALRLRLERAVGSAALGALAQALEQLDAEASALDVLAVRSGGSAADDLARQCVTVTATAGQLWNVAADVLTCDAGDGQVARLLWIELLLETAALDKRVRAGTKWLAELHEDLAARRALASMDVTHRALDELARRAQELHTRLDALRRLGAQARVVHAACERLSDERAVLCRTLQQKVRAGSARLQAAMQPIVRAADTAQLGAAELVAVVDARHELQVALTQAGAELARVRVREEEAAQRLQDLAEAAQLA